MHMRKLGKTGFDVSEVGLGCWQLGADWGAPVAKDKGFEILQAALDKGVTFFDTANVYGMGKSERLIGEFLNQTGRKDIRVATKYGRGDVFPDGYSLNDLRKAADASREKLDVETIDLIQLHCIPHEQLQRGEIFDWLRQLQQDKVIRHFGASVETVEEGLTCLEQNDIASLQVIYNLYRQKLTDNLLPQAKAKGVGIIVRLPVASGLLTGKFKPDTVFHEADHRNYNADGQHFNVGETFAGLPFIKGVELAEELKILLPEGYSLADMAQRWLLDHDAVSTIIPGASAPDQIARNAHVSNLASLSAQLHQHLRDFYHNKVASHIRGAY